MSLQLAVQNFESIIFVLVFFCQLHLDCHFRDQTLVLEKKLIKTIKSKLELWNNSDIFSWAGLEQRRQGIIRRPDSRSSKNVTFDSPPGIFPYTDKFATYCRYSNLG